MTTRSVRASAPALGGGTFARLKSIGLTNLLFLSIAIFGSIHTLTMLTIESFRAINSSREIARLSTDVLYLQDEIVELNAIVAHAGDELYLEQLARCMGYAYPDETRYITMLEVKDQPPGGVRLCR